MAKIQFVHSGCNGWAACESKYIEGEDPKNIHVLEVTFRRNDAGEMVVVPNSARETCCGNYRLKSGTWACLYASQNADEMRNKLASLENDGKEVCGRCVAYFYADQG